MTTRKQLAQAAYGSYCKKAMELDEEGLAGHAATWAELDAGTQACWIEAVKFNAQAQFNQLTPAEAERLALLAEECGEVMQAIGKVLRHGFESTHPDGGPTNREALERECGDVYHAISRLIGAHDIDGNGMTQRADDKAKSVISYLHHQVRNDELLKEDL